MDFLTAADGQEPSPQDHDRAMTVFWLGAVIIPVVVLVVFVIRPHLG